MAEHPSKRRPIPYNIYNLFINYLLGKSLPDVECLMDGDEIARTSTPSELDDDGETENYKTGANSSSEKLGYHLDDTGMSDQSKQGFCDRIVSKVCPNDGAVACPEGIAQEDIDEGDANLIKKLDFDQIIKSAFEKSSIVAKKPLKTNRPEEFFAFKALTADTDLNSTVPWQKTFLQWSQEMYIKVKFSSEEKNFQVISLMSKRTNREIVPCESFKMLVQDIHTQNGRAGSSHLNLTSTISKYKSSYTFGSKDFGISKEVIKRLVECCNDEHCRSRFTPGTAKLGNRDSIHSTTLLGIDPFYQDVMQVIVARDQELTSQSDLQEEKHLKRCVSAIKRAGNPRYYARTQKRRMAEYGNNAGSPVVIPRQKNPAEELSLSESYDCLVTAIQQMRKEFIYMCNGERRHYENLTRSLTAAQVLVCRCLSQQKRLINEDVVAGPNTPPTNKISESL